MVPEGWSRRRFSEVGGGRKNAIVDGPFGSNLKSEHYRKTGIPVFQSGFVTSGRFVATNYVYVDEELFTQQSRSAAHGGDILMAKIGAQAGRCAVIPASHPTGILAGNSLKITPHDDEYDRDFILNWLHFRYARTGLAEVKSTTAQPAISIKNLKSLWIEAPPLPEQRKIAEILSTWDRAIEATEALLANARTQKRALMQSLLTGKRRFPEFVGEERREARLGEFFNSRRERGCDGVPTLSVTLDRGLVKRDTIERKMDTKLTAEEHLRVHPGDIAYNMMRMWQGASGLAFEDAIVSPAYIVLAPRPNIDPEFAAHLFKLPEMIHRFWAFSYGLTNDRLRLYFKDLAKVPVRIPGIDEQRKIAKVISASDDEIEKLTAERSKLVSEKKALMQQLLTGRRRVMV